MPPVGEGTYDLAISFLTPHYFVAQKVQARKKIAWIHTDYSKIAVEREQQLRMWDPYREIISISPQVTEGFVKTFPELKGRVTEIGHILPVSFIREQAQEKDVKDEVPVDEMPRLLSIGRFCKAKNFDNVPDICRCLLEMGVPVKWYLIGYGGDEELIRRRIAESGMEEHVIIFGKRTNPYPYIESCDLYVQPSRYEGKCVSVIEAQILHKPVVITRYPTAGSQLEDGVDGVIVPTDNEGCAKGIADLLRDSERMEKLRQNCAAREYSNAQEIKKLYELV
jgi:glycosyltransferase involved in cell wall biosynthesis